MRNAHIVQAIIIYISYFTMWQPCKCGSPEGGSESTESYISAPLPAVCLHRLLHPIIEEFIASLAVKQARFSPIVIRSAVKGPAPVGRRGISAAINANSNHGCQRPKDL